MKLQVAKLRLTVNTLSGDNVPGGVPAEEITELCGYYSNFALNQIPTATINIPIGSKLQGSTLAGSFRMKDWSYYMQNRVPVCVVLEVKSNSGIDGLLAKTSKTDEQTNSSTDTTHELIRADEGKFCLFKGYITNINPSYGAKHGTLEIALQHWLSDLTLIPILNPLSSPENPTSLAMESCFKATYTEETENTANIESEVAWTPALDAGEVVHEEKGNLFDAIKTLFEHICQTEYVKNPNSAGAINQELYKTVFNAFNAISGEELELNAKFNTTDATLRTAIGQSLESQIKSTYYSVTIWDKLITALLPAHRMALVPLVDRAVVIPAPGIFMSDKEKPDVTPDHTTQLNVSLSKTGMLAGMSLICRPDISIGAPCTVPAGHTTCYRYPAKHTKPGVFKVCQLPSWLEEYLNCMNVFSSKLASLDVFADPIKAVEDLLDNAKKIKDTIEANYTIVDKLCQAFVKTTYFSEVTRQNSALLIANLDLRRVPGSVLKIQLPSPEPFYSESEFIHGVITSLGHTITPNSVQASYRLNHVRDTTLLDDPDLNNTDDVIFQSGWKAVNASLAEVVK